METWKILAILSMLFSGFTASTAKLGMQGATAQVAMLFRVLIILGFVMVDFIRSKSFLTISSITGSSLIYLTISGIAAGGSWLCYYHAIKEGNVSVVNTIDKASIVITLVLSFLWLKEPMTWQVMIGGGLVLAGMIVLIKN
jgi:bacterial/archaeal transporter family protein